MEETGSNQVAEPRNAPLEMSPEEFRALGYRLVDRVAEFLGSLPSRPVSPGESPREIRAILGDSHLPERGTAAEPLLDDAVRLLVEHSLVQWPSALYGIHYFARRSPGCAGRVAGGGR